MRDLKKRCGLTVHQKSNEQEAHQTYQEIDAERLGLSCPEFPYKPMQKRLRKAASPPTDFLGRAYLGILDPSKPFSLFLWYTKRQPSDPDVCCVDLTVDGKRSPGWILKSGRENGICVSKIMIRGESKEFEFTPTKSQGFSGTIHATFWRVMKIENEYDPEQENAGYEFIPDEGLKALCVLQLYYRDMAYLKQNMIIKPKKPAGMLSSELSTCLSDPVVEDSRNFNFALLERVSNVVTSFHEPVKPPNQLFNVGSKHVIDRLQSETGPKVLSRLDFNRDVSFKKPSVKSISGETKSTNENHQANESNIENEKSFVKSTDNNQQSPPREEYRKRITVKVYESPKAFDAFRVTVDYQMTLSALAEAIRRQIQKGPESYYWIDKNGSKYEWKDLKQKNIFEIEQISIEEYTIDQ